MNNHYVRSVVPLLCLTVFAGLVVSCDPVPEKQSNKTSSVEVVNQGFPEYDPLVIKPAPVHGDTMVTNPPGFHWPPEEGAEGFILEISRDNRFSEERQLLRKAIRRGALIPESLSEEPVVYQGGRSWLIAGLPLPIHRSSFTLEPGTWYWRWRTVMQGNDIQPPSSIRKFTISPGFTEHTIPPLKDLYSNIPDSHPRLFIQPQQLDSLRGLLQTSKPHRDLYARIAAYADSLLVFPLNQEPKPRSDGYKNYWRDYYEQARKSGQVLDFLGFCYLMTGEEKYAERAKEWLLTFAGWDLEGTTSLAANDEFAMPILLNGARAYDWIYDYLNEEERVVIRDMLEARGEEVYKMWRNQDFHFKPYVNHSVRLVSYMSQVGVVLYGEAPKAEKWLSYVIPVATTFYPPWGGRDGGYAEGPSYWMMYFNYMLQSAHCLKSAMGLDVMKTRFYRNNGWYKIYAYPYYGKMQPFGDTGVGSYWPADKMNLYRLATQFQNPYFRWRAEMSPPEKIPVLETKVPSGIMSFFWLDETSETIQPKAPDDDLPGARVFKEIGLVAFHEDLGNPEETYFLLKSSPFGAWSHIYADQNAFYIQGFGEALAIQSGYYSSYGGPHHQGWTRQTKAHNTILVDGEGQSMGNRETSLGDRTSRGKIIAFRMGNGEPGSVDYAAGDATEAYKGRLDKFIRHVYYQRPRDFLLIDELEAPVPVRYDWLLHSLEKMEIDRKNNKVMVSKGKARLIVEFLSPQELEFSQTDEFSPPPPARSFEGYAYPDQWHLTVSTKQKSRATTFIVRMKVRETE